MKLEFSRKIYEKYSNIKFNEHPSSGTLRVHVDGQTRRADTDVRVYNGANLRFTQFC